MILLEVDKDKSFPLFTSHLSHELKRKGDIEFINTVLLEENLDTIFSSGQYRRTLYLVAMIEYLCRINNVPVKKEIQKYQEYKLKDLTFFDDVETYFHVTEKTDLKEQVMRDSLPEFLKYNIAERNVRRAV